MIGDDEGFCGMAFFSTVAVFLAFFLVWPNARCFDSINYNIAIVINTLSKFFGSFQGCFRQLIQGGECTFQIIVCMPGAQTEMKPEYIEGRIGFEIE